MWDNGAFSTFTRGAAFDEPGYYAWLEDKLGHPHWAVVPDVIGGDAMQQIEMVARWPYPRAFSAPVWHMHLPIGYLMDLLDGWPKICFGSSERYWQVGSDAWRRRADEAWNAIAQRSAGYLPWVHMLRGLSLIDDHYPFASADSANVGRNHKRNGCPQAMAELIDSAQTPIRWTPPPIQEDLWEHSPTEQHC